MPSLSPSLSSSARPPYTAALLLAGEAPSAAQLERFLPQELQDQLYWVAADGGYRHASRYDLQVQCVVGDFDSLNPDELQAELQAVQVLRFATGKDESDRNLALQHLQQLGHKEIVQVGGGGQRSDHFLAMIYDYRRFSASSTPSAPSLLPRLWLTRYEAIYYLKEKEQIELHFGAAHEDTKMPLISVFPLYGTETSEKQKKLRLRSESLQWPLQDLKVLGDFDANADAEPKLPYSLSNWATQEKALIAAEAGAVLVFCPYAESHLTAAKISLI